MDQKTVYTVSNLLGLFASHMENWKRKPSTKVLERLLNMLASSYLTPNIA